jgi:hypothetical protein
MKKLRPGGFPGRSSLADVGQQLFRFRPLFQDLSVIDQLAATMRPLLIVEAEASRTGVGAMEGSTLL